MMVKMSPEKRAEFGSYFDHYRRVYDRMSFAQVQQWNSRITLQERPSFRREIMGHILGICDKDDRVVELGCHYGELASVILSSTQRIAEWRGYDANRRAEKLNSCRDERFTVHVMDDWFHLLGSDVPDYEIFISSHTIEHLNDEQAYETVKMVCRKFKKVIFDIPIAKRGQSWERDCSTHVLSIGRKQFKKWMASSGFDLVVETIREKRGSHSNAVPKNWETTWAKRR